MEPLSNESNRMSSYNPITTNPEVATASNVAYSHPSVAVAPNNACPLVVYTGPMQSGESSAPQRVPKRKRGRPIKTSFPNIKSESKRGFIPHNIGESKRGFIPHIINVVAGEDVGKKIMLFMEERKSDICILSASGLISLACLREPSPSGGITKFEGKFRLLSLTGSFIHPRPEVITGGIYISLGYFDGRIIGGRVNGDLIAAGHTKVNVVTFNVDPDKIFYYKERRVETSAQTGNLPEPNLSICTLSMMDYSHLSPEENVVLDE